MSDQELLEMAAKATGLRLEWRVPSNAPDVQIAFNLDAKRIWNPLADDGDALRLAVMMGMRFDCDKPMGSTIALCVPTRSAVEDHGADAFSATRRAIVRAAAEIGRGM